MTNPAAAFCIESRIEKEKAHLTGTEKCVKMR